MSEDTSRLHEGCYTHKRTGIHVRTQLRQLVGMTITATALRVCSRSKPRCFLHRLSIEWQWGKGTETLNRKLPGFWEMLVNSFMLRLLNFRASSVPSRARWPARGCALQVCAGFLV